MLNQVRPIECVQSRERASARLDGELSELDEVRLDAHLRGCAECRAYAEELAAVTAALRAAALERPEAAVFLPRRGRLQPIRVRTVAAAAALVAAAAGSSFALGRELGTSRVPTQTATTAADVVSLQADSTRQHLLAMLDRVPPPPVRPGRLRAV